MQQAHQFLIYSTFIYTCVIYKMAEMLLLPPVRLSESCLSLSWSM